MPILEYGADEGYQPLRENLAKWLGHHYRVSAASNRICITGGASQSLACILQSFTDVNYTRAVWMVAPCYHLVARIFEDAGFEGRLKSAPEDDDGLDVGILERRIQALEDEEKSKVIGPVRETFCTLDHWQGASAFQFANNLDPFSHISRRIRSANYISTSSTAYQPAPTPPARQCPSSAARLSLSSRASTTP